MIVTLPSFAVSKDVTMQAGETKTLYLPSSVTSLDLRSVAFYSNGISYVQVLSYNNYSVTVKAIKAFSSPIIVRCDYYYFVRNGNYTYQTKGYYDFKVTVVGETKVQPTSISFPSTVVAVEVGESRQLTPTVLPANAEYTLTWSINDKSVATISKTGLLTGKSEGYADLKVSADNGVYTMLRVAVSEPSASSVSVTPSSLSLVEGDTRLLSASVSPSVANQSVTWTSNNTSVAKVSNSGKVTAVSPGSCRITAKTSNGRTDYCSVTVTKKVISPTSISLPESIDMTVGDNKTLTPTIIPADAGTTLTWSSSDGNIAAVSNGTIEAKSVGACDITVSTSNGLTSTCRVNVKPVLPESISLSENLELRIGDSEQLSAVILPTNAETTLTWTSSDENVASVSEGNVNAVGIGECDITVVTSNGLAAQCHVIVKPVLPTHVTLSAEEIVITEGATEQLTATIEPVGAENIISWHSTDETIASVSYDGLVTALSEGSCRITATTSNNLMAYCIIHVQKATVEPTGISVIPDIELTIGEVYDIIPDIKPADASTSLYWESDNNAVATVDNGSITALSEGECNVTVTTSNNLSAVCHVVVKAKVVAPESIQLSEYDVTLTVGENRTLTASVYPAEASATLDWISTDESVVTVNDGYVIAVGAGQCEIIASAGNGIENSCHIVVVSASVPDEPEITSDWSGTYRMTSSIVQYRESTYAYPSEFDLTIVEREDGYYITSIIGMDCTSGYPYEGMKLIIESPSKAYINLEHNDGLGWKDISGFHIDNLHSMSLTPEYLYYPQPVYLTRTSNDNISIQDFYVFAFGSDTDYEQEKEARYTNCSGLKDSSGMSGIQNMTIDEDNHHMEVYDFNGVRVFSGEKSQIPQLRNGIYIFRSGNESHKVIIK